MQNLNDEKWQNIKDYEGLYQVSTLGRVKSLGRRTRWGFIHRDLILKPNLDNYGYAYVNLYNGTKRKSIKVHRLVAITFIANPHNKPQVNHKDGIKIKNEVTNLEWATQIENITHRQTVLNIHYRGDDVNTAKLIEKSVLHIRNSKKSLCQLAEKYHVCKSTIHRIKNRETWKHI